MNIHNDKRTERDPTGVLWLLCLAAFTWLFVTNWVLALVLFAAFDAWITARSATPRWVSRLFHRWMSTGSATLWTGRDAAGEVVIRADQLCGHSRHPGQA